MKKTVIEEMVINALYGEAKQFAFGPYDNPSYDDIEDSTGTVYEFAKGMKVFMSEDVQNFIERIYFIYAYEIRTGNKYDGDDIDESFPHLYKEGGRR